MSVVFAQDVGGHALKLGDQVRDEQGLLWTVNFNDPYFPHQYGCKPFLMYHSPNLLSLGDRLPIEDVTNMTYAADQPNVVDHLLRNGFCKPCAGGIPALGVPDEKSVTGAGRAGGCGCGGGQKRAG